VVTGAAGCLPFCSGRHLSGSLGSPSVKGDCHGESCSGAGLFNPAGRLAASVGKYMTVKKSGQIFLVDLQGKIFQ
jgi:hypothetical protein